MKVRGRHLRPNVNEKQETKSRILRGEKIFKILKIERRNNMKIYFSSSSRMSRDREPCQGLALVALDKNWAK